MSAYTAGTVGSQHGVIVVVRNAETPASGSGGASASQAVALPDTSFTKLRPFSVDTKFTGAPGAFEDDIQVANEDIDANYQTILNGNITTVDAVNNTYHVDVPNNTAKFVRILCRTQNANAVAQRTIVTP